MAAAGLTAMNTIDYRFHHMLGKESYEASLLHPGGHVHRHRRPVKRMPVAGIVDIQDHDTRPSAGNPVP